MQSNFRVTTNRFFAKSNFFVFFLSILFSHFSFNSFSQPKNYDSSNVIVGAERMNDYLSMLAGKKIALVVNQTSVVGKTPLVDTLLERNVAVKKIFVPEHGFRGSADAGEEISSAIDPKTGLPIISLYGKTYKPAPDQLKDVDLVIYDIQDVGVRFYTFISTLHYMMEACAENHIALLVLDRPNPNGFYVDGPVIDSAYKSFVGVDPIPIVYGMTPAEYANMVNGEHWLENGVQCDLHWITCLNYTHNTLYQLPVNPSPNLRNMTAIYLYPSLCLFEGTQVSVGRGTDKPFMLIGYPGFKMGNMKFEPKSVPGAKTPPYLNQICDGFDLSGLNSGFFAERKHLFLQWLMETYHWYPNKQIFFTSYFEKLAGTNQLRKQLEKGFSEMEIRRSWEPGLSEFKTIRKKYLLYKDFE